MEGGRYMAHVQIYETPIIYIVRHPVCPVAYTLGQQIITV